MTNQTQLKTIQFNNQSLITFEQNGTRYTAMRPICENIGLEWGSQYNRIKRDEVLSQGVVIMTIPSNGGEQQMVCLPIEYLNGWLFGIDVNRVKPEIRGILIRYKKECYQALHDYWNKGVAINESAVKVEKLSKEHQVAIKDLVLGRVKNLPKEQQAGVIIKQWAALKAHFGKSYKEINDDQFVEAVSLLARLPLEGELIIEPQNDTYSIELTKSELNKLIDTWMQFTRLAEATEFQLKAIRPFVYGHFYSSVEFNLNRANGNILATKGVIEKLLQVQQQSKAQPKYQGITTHRRKAPSFKAGI